MFVATQQRASCPPLAAEQSAVTVASSLISAASVLGVSRPDQIVHTSSTQASLAQLPVGSEVRFNLNSVS
jgi:hypothetical protein